MTAPVAIFGIGNRSRGDDAVGPLLVEGLSRWLDESGLGSQFEIFEEYQLQPEHALDLAGRRLVLFVDAREDLDEPVRLEPLSAAGSALSASTHALSPGETLAVYRTIMGEEPPPAFALCVHAEAFELGAAPGDRAREAMWYAEALLRQLCRMPVADGWHRLSQHGDSASHHH